MINWAGMTTSYLSAGLGIALAQTVIAGRITYFFGTPHLILFWPLLIIGRIIADYRTKNYYPLAISVLHLITLMGLVLIRM